MLLEFNNVPYEPCLINLARGRVGFIDYFIINFYFLLFFPGDGFKEEFRKISPAGKVPAIDDDGFQLIERFAIVSHSFTYPLSLQFCNNEVHCFQVQATRSLVS